MTLTMPKPFVSIEALTLYGLSIGLPEDECGRMFDFYQSKGWLVGRSPMRDYEAAARNWKRTWAERRGTTPVRPAQQIDPPWVVEKRLKAELEVLRARLFKVGDVSPIHSHEQAAQIRAARLPILDRIKQVKIELGLL
jgi:hypothetical protein